MNKPILYYDCDGVILNTIKMAKIMANEQGIDPQIRSEFDYFFQIVDWNILIFRAGILDNAIRKINKVLESNKYIVKILTKLSGNEEEELIKRRLFAKLLPAVEVITLDIDENKDEIVDPKNNILIEDSPNNAKRWEKAGGIAILLNDNILDYEHNIISNIDDFENTAGIKKLIKTGF